MGKQFMTAADVAEIMDCSVRHGYKIIHELNDELKAKEYSPRSGRVPRKDFYQRTGLEMEEVTA